MYLIRSPPLRTLPEQFLLLLCQLDLISSEQCIHRYYKISICQRFCSSTAAGNARDQITMEIRKWAVWCESRRQAPDGGGSSERTL